MLIVGVIMIIIGNIILGITIPKCCEMMKEKNSLYKCNNVYNSFTKVNEIFLKGFGLFWAIVGTGIFLIIINFTQLNSLIIIPYLIFIAYPTTICLGLYSRI